MLVKGLSEKVEFGTYGNYATLIPLEIINIEAKGENNYRLCVRYAYAYDPNKTIDLCDSYKLDEIDFKSFGMENIKI